MHLFIGLNITMRILITGDSWGCGEWDGLNDDYRVTHAGIEQYLRDDGYDVENISIGGNNNLMSYHLINDNVFDHLIFFWTDPLRQATWEDFTHDGPMATVEKHTDLMMQRLDQFPKVTLIGGCAKIQYYNYRPNLHCVIPSFTELLVPGFVDSPYMISHEWEDHWKNIRKPSDQFKREIVDISEQAEHKQSVWRKHPDLFWPDWYHANRQGIRIVYDHMRSLWNTD